MMSDRKPHGMSGFRAIRSPCAAEEVGIAYEHAPVTFREDSKDPASLAIDPNGRIPVLARAQTQMLQRRGCTLEFAAL